MKGLLIALLLVCALPGQARADDSWWAWAKQWLRSANTHVERGNEKLLKGDHAGALKNYEDAVRELPANGGVHLNRGLALLEKGQLAEARQALSLATQPPAPNEVRADAYYNLGSTFYAEGDVSAGEDDHETAQKNFREAADALRQSLRLKPGNRSAAWNLELALRRLNEEKQKQEQKEEEEKEQEEENEEKDEQQDGEQDPDGEPNEDGEQDPGQDEGQKPEEDKPEEPKQDPESPKPDEPKQDDGKSQQPQQPEQAKPEPLPEDARRALDALQDGEQNLERLRAQQRAARERRRPRKDW